MKRKEGDIFYAKEIKKWLEIRKSESGCKGCVYNKYMNGCTTLDTAFLCDENHIAVHVCSPDIEVEQLDENKNRIVVNVKEYTAVIDIRVINNKASSEQCKYVLLEVIDRIKNENMRREVTQALDEANTKLNEVISQYQKLITKELGNA